MQILRMQILARSSGLLKERQRGWKVPFWEKDRYQEPAKGPCGWSRGWRGRAVRGKVREISWGTDQEGSCTYSKRL